MWYVLDDNQEVLEVCENYDDACEWAATWCAIEHYIVFKEDAE